MKHFFLNTLIGMRQFPLELRSVFPWFIALLLTKLEKNSYPILQKIWGERDIFMQQGTRVKAKEYKIGFWPR